ncbi:MAG: ammonium transporter [Rhodospirillaceae bacterium]|nr:ammonium transporter [Rhodospirillaceae bacterium]MBT5299738.1 ammonium transporter [Rhodospirillaceae bacterium]MBT5512521.1 ammonium transporter [Rhodospirillaceae bacterium]MBT6087372.1 ammonium transporter [Rhodospirillaceae bacterium]MBT6607243.1 ammonium transporter [Rhodospirillaceae bacterium]
MRQLKSIFRIAGLTVLAMALVGLMPAVAEAAEATLNGGNTAWILTATALVLFMTLPGLALFYGGLVQAKNVLSVFMQCFAIACLMSVLWLLGVYSLAFTDGGSANALIGGLDKAFLAGVSFDTLSGDIPESVFFMFQMTFAIITPALIVGAYPERMKFSSVMVFSGLWLILVYAPVCHWVWGGGWLADMGVMDFAGGLVVHATAGTSALVLVACLGNRQGFPKQLHPPHSPGMTMMGAAMLWVGWFGFNGGSALSAGGSAGMAMTVTHLSAATASLVWVVIEWRKFGKPSLVGIVTGTIAGLATITPASGYVGPLGGICIGLAGGIVCYYAVGLIKQRFELDDSLDVFAVHGVGGMLGTVMAGVFAAASLGGVGFGEGGTMSGQVTTQVIGVGATVIWSAIVTWIIVKVTEGAVGLRATDDEITEGLDLSYHGERDYNF